MMKTLTYDVTGPGSLIGASGHDYSVKPAAAAPERDLGAPTHRFRRGWLCPASTRKGRLHLNRKPTWRHAALGGRFPTSDRRQL